MRSRALNWVAVGVLSALATVAGPFALTSPALAYSAAQAEAQTEPYNDPYSFPNIELCCKPHPPHPSSYCDRFPDSPRCICRRRHHGHGHGDDDGDRDGGHHGHHDDDGDHECRDGGWHGSGGGDSVDVDCGANPKSRHVFTTLQEAVDDVEPGGVIRVRSAFPGSGCVGNIVITKSLTIQGVGAAFDGDRGDRGARGDDAYRGAPGDREPVTAVVDGCISIWGPGRPRVALRDIEILGTTTGYVKDCNPVPTVNEGSNGLTPPRSRSGENLFTALMVDGGTLIGSNVSVRSAGRAFYAEHSVVEFTGGNFAAHPAYDAADAAVWLLRTQAAFRGVSIAGGRDGVVISMLDRYPVTFTDVAILPVRTQVGGVYPEDGRLYRGKTGVRVKVDYEDLPSTADHDVAEFKWSGGTVHGYRQGIDVGPGVNGTITGVAIVDTKRAAHFARGAQVAFDSNKITGSQGVALQIDPGAIGEASANEISCTNGECICYGDHCGKDDSDIDAHGFVLRGNQCRSEHDRHRSYEDVGGDDE
jgi:hypothetical protein